jgi:hypothetical protein
VRDFPAEGIILTLPMSKKGEGKKSKHPGEEWLFIAVRVGLLMSSFLGGSNVDYFTKMQIIYPQIWL